MYGGLAVMFFFLVIFLQQVAGYTALEAGLATLPATVVMFLLSRRFGALADRYGPRLFMGVGPLVAAAGILLLLRARTRRRLRDRPAAGAARLRARAVDDGRAAHRGRARRRRRAQRGHRLGRQQRDRARLGADRDRRRGRDRRRALRRRDGLAPRRAAAGGMRDQPLTAARRRRPPTCQAAARDASISSFHLGIGIAGTLVAVGGVLGLVGIVNPRREVAAEDCPGGQFVGAPRGRDAAIAVRLAPVRRGPAGAHSA